METLQRKLDKRGTKSSYKKVAWFYDLWSSLTESMAADKVLELADIKNGEKILEIACGTGVVFEKIVKRNPDGKNVGVDLSPEMLTIAKKRLKKRREGNYELREGDALNLDFPDESFDVVVNNFMIDLMPEDKFDMLASEFYRVLVNNGLIVVSIFSEGERKVNRIWWWVAKYLPSLLTGCRPVSFTSNLQKAGFRIEKEIQISQNTFPSQVIKAVK